MRIRQTLACEGDDAEQVTYDEQIQGQTADLRFASASCNHDDHLPCSNLPMRGGMSCRGGVVDCSSLSHSDRHSEVIADHATRVRFASMIGPLCDQSFRPRDHLNQPTLVIFQIILYCNRNLMTVPLIIYGTAYETNFWLSLNVFNSCSVNSRNWLVLAAVPVIVPLAISMPLDTAVPF